MSLFAKERLEKRNIVCLLIDCESCISATCKLEKSESQLRLRFRRRHRFHCESNSHFFGRGASIDQSVTSRTDGAAFISNDMGYRALGDVFGSFTT